MVTIEIGAVRASINEGEWMCDDALTRGALSVMTRQWEYATEMDYIADRDRAIADFAAKELGGVVVQADEQEFVPERIY